MKRRIIKKNRVFKGVWIPAKIWLAEDLKLMEIALLTEIDSLDNENGCTASNSYFADFFGKTPQRISQVIKSLKEKGYIAVRYERDGNQCKSRTIKVLSKFDRGYQENLQGYQENLQGYQENLQGYQENFKANNTVNNTNNNTDNNQTCRLVFEFYEKNIGFLPPILREEIEAEFDDWMKINPDQASDIMIEALKNAIGVQASNKWKYAKSILRSWMEKNIKSISDIKADDEQHRRQMDMKYQKQFGRKPREEKMPDWTNVPQEEASPEDIAEIQRLLKKINDDGDED